MKMLFRQRFFSWLDSYDVHAEDGTVLFTVKGVLSWRYTLKIFTPDGREAGMIKARMITFPKPVFDLTVNGGAAGCIIHGFYVFRRLPQLENLRRLAVMELSDHVRQYFSRYHHQPVPLEPA